jgi:hypothetical protein
MSSAPRQREQGRHNKDENEMPSKSMGLDGVAAAQSLPARLPD